MIDTDSDGARERLVAYELNDEDCGARGVMNGPLSGAALWWRTAAGRAREGVYFAAAHRAG